MAGKAERTLPFNALAVKAAKAIDGSRTEWRVEGVRGLVLFCQPSGAATWFFFYTAKLGTDRKLRKVQIGGRDAVTLQEARAKAIELLRAVEAGGDPVEEARAKALEVSFKTLAERFVEESPSLGSTTRPGYRYLLEREVYPVIGDMPASDVTADHVVAICRSIEAGGSMSTSERTKTVIGGVYRWARKERLVKVTVQPCTGLGRRGSKVARSRTPDGNEIATLWHAAVGAGAGVKLTPETYKTKGYTPRPRMPVKAIGWIIRLAILTGARRTEVAACRVSELHDLDGAAPTWIIPGDVNSRGKITEGRTKNGREHRVPLSRQAADIFREAMAGRAGDILFPADMTRVKIGATPRYPHIDGGSVSKAMRRLRAEAGVEDITCHDMRRAISNYLKDNDVSREVRDLVLNHTDSSVTEAHYSQSARMTRQVSAAMQLWADYVWTITGQSVPASNVVPMVALAKAVA
jgi:integrase